MHPVAARLAGGEQMRQRGLGVGVHVDAAHEVVLGGHDGHRLAEHIVALSAALLADVREVVLELGARHVLEAQPHVLGALRGHLAQDRGRHDVSRLELVAKALARRVEQDRALAARRLADEEAAARLARPERGGVDLHEVHVLEQHAVLGGHAAAVAREAGVVRRVLVEAAHAARGEHRGVGVYLQVAARGVLGQDPAAHAGAGGVETLEDVRHAGVLEHGRVRQLAHAREQVRGDLLAGDVLVIDDARAGVRALAGVVELARLRAREADSPLDQVVDNGSARADHHVHGLQAVLVVARAQRVLEERLVVVGVVQHADAALGEHRVALVHGRLG